jgi:hypothetical protein
MKLVAEASNGREAIDPLAEERVVVDRKDPN